MNNNLISRQPLRYAAACSHQETITRMIILVLVKQEQEQEPTTTQLTTPS